MRPPSALKVFHATFAISASGQETEAQAADGFTHGGTRRIVVRPDLVEDRAREVMLHEALHACFHVSGYDPGEKAEERIVSALTGPVLDMLRRNPRLVTYLTTS